MVRVCNWASRLLRVPTLQIANEFVIHFPVSGHFGSPGLQQAGQLAITLPLPRLETIEVHHAHIVIQTL